MLFLLIMLVFFSFIHPRYNEAVKHTTHSESQTQALAAKLASQLKGGAIELIGDVGAGKTTFVKGLARGLGLTETITSPTFTISQVYTNSHGPDLYHYDFYCLSEPGLMSYELVGSLSNSSALTVVEWADSVTDILPKKRVTVIMTAISEHERQIEIKGITK